MGVAWGPPPSKSRQGQKRGGGPGWGRRGRLITTKLSTICSSSAPLCPIGADPMGLLPLGWGGPCVPESALAPRPAQPQI